MNWTLHRWWNALTIAEIRDWYQLFHHDKGIMWACAYKGTLDSFLIEKSICVWVVGFLYIISSISFDHQDKIM